MDCRRAQLLLLQTDDARAAPPELAAHLGQCAACLRLADKVARLETAWRDQPAPAEAERARVAFVKRMARHPAAAARRAARSWRVASVRWAAAAVLLIATGMGALMLLPAARVEAAPDLVGRMVEWNLRIAQAPTPEDRRRAHAEHAHALGRALDDGSLAAEDRRLAQHLLETGGRLVRAGDALAEADQLDDMTEALVEHMQAAAERGQALRVNQLARQFQRVAARTKARAADRAAAVHPDREKKLARLAEREDRRLTKLEKMLEKAPNEARKELKKAVDGAQKKPEKNPRKGISL